jgi:hypothetical protein
MTQDNDLSTIKRFDATLERMANGNLTVIHPLNVIEFMIYIEENAIRELINWSDNYLVEIIKEFGGITLLVYYHLLLLILYDCIR